MLACNRARRYQAAILMAGVILLAPGISYAQEGPSNSLAKGAKALQFRIVNNFVLSDFQGVALSGKRHTSDNSAIRLGADIFFEHSSDNQDNRTFSYDTTLVTSDAKTDGQRLNLELQYIHYPSIERKIKFFWGAGPSVRFMRDITKTDYYNSQTGNSLELKDEVKSWGAGGSGVLGAEWFATSGISLHTEYTVSIFYEWQKIRDDEVTGPGFSTANRERNGLEINASSVRFGLSLYF